MKKSVTFPPQFFLGKSFLAENQNVGIIGKGGAEKIVGASFVEFEPFAKFGNGKGKIANREVCFLNVFQKAFQFLFIKMRGTCDFKDSSWEIGNERVGGVELAAWMEFFHVEQLCHGFECHRLHHGSIRFVEIMLQFGSVVAGGISLDGMGENESLRLLVG